MSYLKDLDEYTTAELEAELARREAANKKSCCDYCGRPRDSKPCRYPSRHIGVIDGPTFIFVNGIRKRVDEFTHLSYEQLILMVGKSGYHLTMTCHYPSTGKACTVLPGEYVTVREGMQINIANTGAA